MESAEKLLKEYLDYLEIEKNRSPKTRENYERYLKTFFRDEKIKNISDITEASVRSFRLQLARRETEAGDAIKKSTQSYYAIAIRNLLKYLVKRGFDALPPDKIELPKVPERQIEIMEYADLERILEAPTQRISGASKQGSGSFRALRDRAILEMLFSTGLRLQELCKLSRYLDFSRGEITVRGKGEKLRVVFVSVGARDALEVYLKARADADEALFISLSKQGKVIGRITSRAIERLVLKYSTIAGVKARVTPHSFRHLFATDLLINGADLRSVQELLGHANIGTTQVYTHLTNKELREIHRTFHGRRRK